MSGQNATGERGLGERGVDPVSLGTMDAIDATLAAVGGLIALEGRFLALGSPDEGLMVVPSPFAPRS